MRAVKGLIGGLIGFQVILWVAVIAGAIYFGPTVFQGIEDMFYGLVDRIDYATGYPGSQ